MSSPIDYGKLVKLSFIVILTLLLKLVPASQTGKNLMFVRKTKFLSSPLVKKYMKIKMYVSYCMYSIPDVNSVCIIYIFIVCIL
jgi:hypothetical protein